MTNRSALLFRGMIVELSPSRPERVPGEIMMTSIRKTLVLACAVSVLGLGAAFAQTDPNAAPAAPAPGGAMTAPAGGDMSPSGDTQTMPKKKMMKKKKMSKKMMKKKMM